MVNTSEEQDVLVVFSREQLERNKELYTKIGEPLPKRYVILNGKPKQYTDILKSENNIIFTDTKILVVGKQSKLKFSQR